jgi:hypothetical protein
MAIDNQYVPPQPIPERGESANSILGAHLGNTDYQLTTAREVVPSPLDRFLEDNERVWRALVNYELSAGMTVTLKDFMVFDWFPRSPGLYHTPDAAFARDEAFYHLHPGFESPIRDHAGLLSQRPADYTMVFTPEGKMSMLEGGIGVIRLKPINILDEYHWLMTASSDGVIHSGIPLAVPRRFLGAMLPAIHQHGAICATVHGEIEFVPDPVSRLFDQVPRVPKVLVRVTGIDQGNPKPIELEGSVAVSFVSDCQNLPKVYATYVTFRPDVKGSFDDATAWMKKTYVEGEYRGRIITDFDQTRTIFPEARLALSKVMDRLVSRGELRETIELMHATASVDSYFDRTAQRELLPPKSRHQRNKVFISYAHAVENETGWVKRIVKHLDGLQHSIPVNVWTDASIVPGRRWREEIEQAINSSRVAILILTPDFLASSFIRDAELPPLLEAADAEGTTILCLYGSTVHLSAGVGERLSRYQSVNDPAEPLKSLSDSDRESVYVKLTALVEEAFLA